MKFTIFLTVCLVSVHFTVGSNDEKNQPTSSSEIQQFREWDFIKESLRGSIFRVYGMNVNPLSCNNAILSRSTCFLAYPFVQYPPVFIPFVINNDNTTKNASMVAYRGIGTKASDYLAQHYDLMYYSL